MERGELSRAGCASDSSVNGTRAGARYTGGPDGGGRGRTIGDLRSVGVRGRETGAQQRREETARYLHDRHRALQKTVPASGVE